ARRRHTGRWGTMRAVLAAIMVALSGVTGSARAASLLFLDSQPGDFIGQGIPQRFTELDGTFQASRNFGNGVSIGFSGGRLGTWPADFVARLGVELREGTYEAPHACRSRPRPSPGCRSTAMAGGATSSPVASSYSTSPTDPPATSRPSRRISSST